MWSVALIVGVAVAASLVLLIAGVTLAVAIERRRHQKYIHRHTAAAKTSVRRPQSACNLDADPEQPVMLREIALHTTPVKTPSMSSSDSTDHAGAIDEPLSVTDLTPARRKSLRIKLRSPNDKKHQSRRKLKRTVPITQALNPTLSSIVEQSEHGQSFDSTEDLTAISHRDSELATSTSGIWLKSNNSGRPAVLAPASQTEDAAKRVCLSQSVSSMRCASSAPEDPLPSLPEGVPDKRTSLNLTSRTSSLSIDSVNTSVLGSATTSPHKVPDVTAKTRSQAIKDFDFGLSPLAKMRSPTYLNPNASHIPRLTGRNSTRSQASSSRTETRARQSSWSDTLKPALDRAEHLDTGPVGRHSMYAGTRLSNKHSKSSKCNSCADENDPFTTHVHARPASVEIGLPLRERINEAVVDQNSSSENTLKGHKRQPCSRISNLPLTAPVPKAFHRLRAMEAEQHVGSPDLILRDPKRQAVDVNGRPKHILTSNNNSTTNLHTYSLQLNYDPTRRSCPATPDTNPLHQWRFDLVLPDTPRAQFPPSPASRNSPILPSPAHASTSLVLRPRRSQILGPRSPRGVPMDFPRSRLPSIRKSNTVAHRSLKQNNGPIDLRRSVQMLRSINSKDFGTDSNTMSRCYRLGSVRSITGSPNYMTTHDSRSGQTSAQTSRMRHPRSVPSSPLLHSVDETEARRSVSTTQSRYSLGAPSIWEDVSVHDDSPEPEMPPFTPTKHGSRLSGTGAPEDRLSTPRAKVEDYDAYENFVANYGRKSQASFRKSRSGKTVGLGLHVAGVAVPDTPMSMYDKQGFLKD